MARMFNDTAGGTGLIQLMEQNIFGDTGFGQISGDTQRLQQATNYINEAYSQYTMIALKSDGKWQFDDTNYTDYPFAVTDLVANQQDYQFLTSMVEILSVEVQSSAGIWYTMSEVDEQEMANDHISMTQRFIVNSQPWVFNRTANSIFLLPAPNYSKSGGLKVKYQRPPSYFVYTDTTKVPGFTDLTHEYLSDYGTWKYAINKSMSLKTDYRAVLDGWEQVKIPDIYLKREKDTTKKLYPKYTYRR